MARSCVSRNLLSNYVQLNLFTIQFVYKNKIQELPESKIIKWLLWSMFRQPLILRQVTRNLVITQ